MSGPNAENGYGWADDELERILHRELTHLKREADLAYGIHREPPRFLDDEGVGAEDGE